MLGTLALTVSCGTPDPDAVPPVGDGTGSDTVVDHEVTPPTDAEDTGDDADVAVVEDAGDTGTEETTTEDGTTTPEVEEPDEGVEPIDAQDVPDVPIEPKCTDNSMCTEGVCDPESGKCVECLVEGDCTAKPDQTCKDNKCADKTCEELKKCDQKGLVPVCCKIDGLTYENDCYAKCGNPECALDNISIGACCDDPKGCDCATKHPECTDDMKATEPVCDLEEPPNEYPNQHEACCDGKTLDQNELQPCPGPTTCDEECPTALSPVCAKTTEGNTTYPNSCVMAKCGIDVKAELICDAPCGDPEKETQCGALGCNPVCGEDGTSYYNKCFAAGAALAYEGHACCDCAPGGPSEYVCSNLKNQFDSQCFLDCLGAPGEVKLYDGACSPNCTPPAGAKVACGNLNGDFTKFPSAECATAAGATCVYEGECLFGKNPCPDTDNKYDPVCAEVPTIDGPKQKTFANKCFAGCEGAKTITPGICADCALNCPCDAADAPEDMCKKAKCAPDQCVLYPNLCVPTKCLDPLYLEVDLDKDTCPVTCQ